MDRRWWRWAGIMMIGLLLSGFTLPLQGLALFGGQSVGYEFFYPSGWDSAQVPKDVAVAFQAPGRPTENLSLVISETTAEQQLKDLGTPTQVGQTLIQQLIAPLGSARQANLLAAQSQSLEGKVYYLLEIQVELPATSRSFLDGSTVERHNLASLAIDQGKIYTFTVSVSEERWAREQNLLYSVVRSFRVF